MTSAMAVETASQYDLRAMFEGLDEVTEEQLGCTFDELSAIVATQPDDVLAFEAVRVLVIEARERGFVDQAMQMAITLGAMACTHDHLQELAKEVGGLLSDSHDDNRNHPHSHEDDKASKKHDPKTCEDCKTGRCRRKH